MMLGRIKSYIIGFLGTLLAISWSIIRYQAIRNENQASELDQAKSENESIKEVREYDRDRTTFNVEQRYESADVEDMSEIDKLKKELKKKEEKNAGDDDDESNYIDVM